MKILVDAQLPRRLVALLVRAGHDVIHTLDLPLGNRTIDTVINQLSLSEQRVVVTKDADFVDSFLLRQEPWKLLLVSTGNIRFRLNRPNGSVISTIQPGIWYTPRRIDGIV